MKKEDSKKKSNKIRNLLTLVFILCVSIVKAQVLDLEERTEYVGKAIIKQEKYVKKDIIGYNANGVVESVINYQIIRYADETTKISIDDDNWMLFKTEYVVNEYTGEKTNTPIAGKEYIEGNPKRMPPLIAAKKALPNDYSLEVKNNEIIIYNKPLGLSYTLITKGVSSRVWWWSDFTDFNSFRGKQRVLVKNQSGEVLADLSRIRIKDLRNEVISGGYYDFRKEIMYFVLNYANNTNMERYSKNGSSAYLYSKTGKVNDILGIAIVNSEDSITKMCRERYKGRDAKWVNDRIKEELSKHVIVISNVILVYGLPTDTIVGIRENEAVFEIGYKNGDYLKLSKLKNGEVFDCNLHRPNGNWRVWLDNNNQKHSQFTYTAGPFKGLICTGDFFLSEYARCLSCPAMISWNMLPQPGGDRPTLYDPSKKRTVHVYEKGGIHEDYLAEEEAWSKAAEAEKDKKQEALYQSYCKKYGKSNVDEILLRNNIKVGMPFSVVKAFCNYKLTDDRGSVKWYSVKYGGTYYDEDSNSFKPREYNFAALIREWIIRVENGVVKYVGHNK